MKHNQLRIQNVALKRVRIAACQMASCPNDAKGRRYWEEAVTWRSDEQWKRSMRQSDKRGLQQQYAKNLTQDDVPVGSCPLRVFLSMHGYRN